VPRVPVHIDNGERDIATVLAPAFGHAVSRLRRPGWSRPPTAPAGLDARDARDALDALDALDAQHDDASLAERARVDAEAFGVLYDRYCDQMYRYAHRRLGDHEAAEDVTAEVFFKALRAIDSYRSSTAPFSAWLYRIAANAVIDHARARRVTMTLDVAMDAADRDTPVDEQAIGRVEAAKVWKAVDGLSAAQRTAMTLRFGRDLPIAAIAEHLGRSEGAVKLLLNRGLAAVRAQLDAAGGQEDQR
jgi:RNA polymerase sigma-70 factor (ECF subfamily)